MQHQYGGSWYWRWLTEQMVEKKEEVVNETDSSVVEGVNTVADSHPVGDVGGQPGDVVADVVVDTGTGHSKSEAAQEGTDVEATITVVGRTEESGVDSDEPVERPKKRRRKQVADAGEDDDTE